MKRKKIFKFNSLKKEYSDFEIKFFICCIFYKLKIPLEKDFLFFILQNNDIANYFQTTQAFNSLLKEGFIDLVLSKQVDKNNSSFQKFKITFVGLKALLDFKNDSQEKKISNIIKKIEKEALEYIEIFENKDEVNVKIEKDSKGYMVKCSVSGGDFDLMHLDLYAPDLKQALKVKDFFYKNIDKIYEKLMLSFLS